MPRDTNNILFQFHEGPIKTHHHLQRLRLAAEFQFHEGPIKTGGGKFDFEVREQFQFHEGPIKTWSENMAEKQNQVSIP